MKAASLSPLPSVEKQGTSDVGSYRPGSAKIITAFPNEQKLEKKRRTQSSDIGKKLTCRKSLCLQSNKRKKTKEGPFPVEKVLVCL